MQIKKILSISLLIILLVLVTTPQVFAVLMIDTVAGGGVGDGGAATAAILKNPFGVTVDSSGNIYIADYMNHQIRKVNTSGIISTVAGNGTAGYSGDGGAATVAQLYYPAGVAVDSAGNIYIADYNNNRIRKVNTSGIISTVAGNGTAGYSGDGGAATAAQLSNPFSVAVGSTGNIYIADGSNNRIRKVNTSGIISTVAGNGTAGYSGDGGAATAASLSSPYGVAVDSAGNIYIADRSNNRIRKVNTSGIISTVAGNGALGYSGDGGAATAAQLSSPHRVTVDSSGNIYIADTGNYRIRKVNTSGIISTVAGNGTQGYSGDGGAATAAQINNPYGVAVDSAGNIYIADNGNKRIRKVNTSGIISTVAGNGTGGYLGDGGVATAAQLNNPYGVTVDNNGNIYIADTSNRRIRKVNTSGIISTVAGNGTAGYSGDGGAATAAQLNNPYGVTVDNSGNIYIADTSNRRIRKVNTSGIISTVAGNGTAGYSGDGGAATAASLTPYGVALDSTGNIYIADGSYHRIRKVNTSGIISTVAGNGTAGYSGDGGAATAAQLNNPTGIAVDSTGNIYITDGINRRIRKVNTSGIISTVAGNGTAGYSGDGGAATAAQLYYPTGVAVDSTGNIYIADNSSNRIRKVYDVPVCAGGCGHGQCVSDNVCECDSGYTGSVCDQPVCSSPCVNGACTAPNTCSCDTGYTGAVCDQPICEPACVNGDCTAPNTCECYIGYAGTTCNEPVCSNPCVHGNCTAPDTCECDEGYQGDTCDQPIETPTLIELSYFTALPQAGRVMLEWATESEIANAGFNIYRADSDNGEYVKINKQLIAAKGSAQQGAVYGFIDKNVKNRKTYYYQLEDIDLNGKSTFHEPVSATPRLIYRLKK